MDLVTMHHDQFQNIPLEIQFDRKKKSENFALNRSLSNNYLRCWYIRTSISICINNLMLKNKDQRSTLT